MGLRKAQTKTKSPENPIPTTHPTITTALFNQDMCHCRCLAFNASKAALSSDMTASKASWRAVTTCVANKQLIGKLLSTKREPASLNAALPPLAVPHCHAPQNGRHTPPRRNTTPTVSGFLILEMLQGNVNAFQTLSPVTVSLAQHSLLQALKHFV